MISIKDFGSFKPSQIGGDGGSPNGHVDTHIIPADVSSPPKSEGMGEVTEYFGKKAGDCVVSSPPKSEGMGEDQRKFRPGFRLGHRFQALPNRRGWGKSTAKAYLSDRQTFVSSPPKSEGMGEVLAELETIRQVAEVSSPPKSEGMGEAGFGARL